MPGRRWHPIIKLAEAAWTSPASSSRPAPARPMRTCSSCWPAAVESITVQWPSSRRQEILGDKARALINHHVRLVEGGEAQVVDPLAGRANLAGNNLGVSGRQLQNKP